MSRSTAGKYLLASAAVLLFVGLVAGEAAAVTVSGKVRLDGNPVAGQTVVATEASPSFKFLGEAVTNAGGNYAITLLAAPATATFLVFVDPSDPRFVSAPNDSIEKSFPFTGNNLENVNFDLVTGVALEGSVVVESTNLGAPDVVVFATNGPDTWKFLGQTLTDAFGDYELFAATGQQVELEVDTAGTPFADLTVDPSFIRIENLAGPLAFLDFLLIEGITVQGAVTDAGTGVPVPGALVEAFSVDPVTEVWTWLGDDVAGADGSYSVRVPGDLASILLRVTAAGYLEKRQNVVLGGNPTIANIALTKAVVVSGTVTDGSAGGVGVGNLLVSASDGVTTLATTHTAVNGSYALNLPANSGDVAIHVETAGTDYLSVADQVVNVGAADIPNVNFQLTQGVNISGTVTDAVTNNGVNGAVMTARRQADNALLAQTNTGASGNYTLRVPANSGNVVVHADGGAFYQAEPDQVVNVGLLDIPGVNFALDPVAVADIVMITKAVWDKSRLTVFATSDAQPNVTLTARIEKGVFLLQKQMTFSAARNQYELRQRETTNLDGAKVTVTSSGGGVAEGIVQ